MEKARILLVDDDTVFAYFMSLKLKNWGFDLIDTADSYDSVMDIVKNNRPDIILMDININGPKNGIEVVQEIHQNDIIPVLFMSATCDLQEIRLASSMAYCQYLFKPVDLEVLFSKLTQFVEIESGVLAAKSA